MINLNSVFVKFGVSVFDLNFAIETLDKIDDQVLNVVEDGDAI